jgi:hypothetical protein
MFARKDGSARETRGRWVDSYKTEGFFSKTTVRRGTRFPQPSDPRSAVEIRLAGEHAGGQARMTGGRGVSGLRTGG